jgi:hypothetical protein
MRTTRTSGRVEREVGANRLPILAEESVAVGADEDGGLI